MATYTVTSSPQTVAGAGGSWRLTNGGSVNVFLTLATGQTIDLLAPAATITLAPASDVLAKTNFGTAALTVTSHSVVHSVVSGGTP